MSNRMLAHGGGVAGAISRAGGPVIGTEFNNRISTNTFSFFRSAYSILVDMVYVMWRSRISRVDTSTWSSGSGTCRSHFRRQPSRQICHSCTHSYFEICSLFPVTFTSEYECVSVSVSVRHKPMSMSFVCGCVSSGSRTHLAWSSSTK